MQAMTFVMARLIIQPRFPIDSENRLGQCWSPFGWGDNFPYKHEFEKFVTTLKVLSEYHHGDTNPVEWSWKYVDLHEKIEGATSHFWELGLTWHGQWTKDRWVEFQAREDWCILKWSTGTGNASKFLASHFGDMSSATEELTDWGESQ
jgi:hypothetical protein